MGQRRREAKHLAIPDDLFWVVRGTSGVRGVSILLLKIGDGGKPISGEGVRIGVRWKGGEVVIEWGGDRCPFRGEGVLKRRGHRQVEGRERSRCDR